MIDPERPFITADAVQWVCIVLNLDEDGGSGLVPANPMEELKMFLGYLDAGSGSLILQAVLGGIAGVVVAGRAWKARLFNKNNPKGEPQATDTDDQSALSES